MKSGKSLATKSNILIFFNSKTKTSINDGLKGTRHKIGDLLAFEAPIFHYIFKINHGCLKFLFL